MTREEQINEAVNTYMNGLFEDGVEIPIEDFENIEEGFIAGAEWADEHPISSWINVADDLPCNHKELITKDGITTIPVPTISYDGFLELHNMVKVMSSKGGDRWIWEEGIFPQYWFNLPYLK